MVKVGESFKDFQKLENEVKAFFRKKHSKKNLTKKQKEVCEEMAKEIFINEDKNNWPSAIELHSTGKVKTNKNKLDHLNKLAEHFGLDLFSAAVLNYSQIS